MALGYCLLAYFSVILFCSSDFRTDGALLITNECRVNDSSDKFGKAMFCTSFISNLTSYSFPPNVTRLQIYRSYNLPLALPLAPNLNMLATLELVGNDLKEVSSEMLEGLYNLTELSLKNNRILQLPEDLFKNSLYISKIDLSKNFLLTFEAFTTVLSKLKLLTDVNLSENKLLRNIFNNETEVLNDLSIRQLNIADCSIEVIEKNAFESFHSLSFLDISMNPLGEKAMKNLSQSLNFTALKEFRATDMKFTSHFSSFFLSRLKWSSVEKLDLSNNRFTNFPGGHFPNLKQLVINNCDVDVLFPGSISDMPSLEELTIQKHQIRNIGHDVFYNNPRLISLDLSDFVADQKSLLAEMTIADYSFVNLKNLEILLLRSTPLKGELRQFLLFGLKNLKKLDFLNCAFESIQENAFETLGNLEVLDISTNLISQLAEKSLYGLLSLRDLNLSRNKLAFFKTNGIFIHTPNLKFLNLNYNRIQSLSIDMFLDLPSIEMLQVSDNLIRPWNDKLFLTNPNMTILIFPRNAVSYFTQEMLHDMSHLKFVDFSENPIDCSLCSTLDLQAWMNETNITITQMKYGYHNYDCYSPSALKANSLVDVDLSYLRISCIPYTFDFLKFSYSLISCCSFVTLVIALVWYKWKWNIKYIIFSLRTKTKRFKEHANASRYDFDAFVSYCEKDLPWVTDHLIPAIEENDSNTVLCLLDRNACAGDSVFDSIGAAVERSRTTILVLSNAYMDSNWNVFEIQFAQSKFFEDMRGGLILIFLEPIQKSKIAKNLRYVIKTRTCLQWTKNITGQKLFWERLKLAIKKPHDKGIATHIT